MRNRHARLLTLGLALVAGCSDRPAAVAPESRPETRASAAGLPELWRVFELHGIAFTAPGALRLLSAQGEDSHVGLFESKDFRVEFDYGWYSDDSFHGHLGRPGFRIEPFAIGGRPASLARYDDNEVPASRPLVDAAYFPDMTGDKLGKAGEVKLSFRVCFRDAALADAARRILLSIRIAR